MIEILLIMGAFGIGAHYVASQRGGGIGWFFVGCLLGPIGLAMAFAVKPGEKAPEKSREPKQFIEPVDGLSVRAAWTIVLTLIVIAWVAKLLSSS